MNFITKSLKVLNYECRIIYFKDIMKFPDNIAVFLTFEF